MTATRLYFDANRCEVSETEADERAVLTVERVLDKDGRLVEERTFHRTS